MRGLALTTVAALCACGPSSGPAGQCKDKSILPGDLVITEVFADFKAAVGGSGVDDGKEWFEIFNNGDRPIELTGMRIEHGRPGGAKKSHVMGQVTLEPGQYFVLGNSADDLLPAYVDYGYASDLGDLFNTDSGELSLSCGATEIDRATYEQVKEGRARELTAASFPDYTINDDPLNWCEASLLEFDAGNFGTPGGENDCTPVIQGACNDNGTMRPTVTPMPGDLVITEVMPSPNGTDSDNEWFEVKAINTVDLNGVGLDRASDTANPKIIESPDCIQLQAGSYGVFAHKIGSTMNGGIPDGSVLGTFTFAMPAPGDVQVVVNGAVIDAVSWTTATSGSSLALDPDLEDPVANDQPSNFCNGVAMYGTGGNGTPGAANPQCVLLPPPGMCSDNGTNRAIVKPAVGQLVINEYLANPAGNGTDATQEWFEVANVGAAAFDLNDLGVLGNGATPSVIQSAACISIPTGGFGLLARNSDPAQNGMLPAVDATFSISLASGGKLSVLDGATVIDIVTDLAAKDGVGRQLNPATPSATDNDNAANYCDAKAGQMYGSAANLGTPKAANVCM